MTVEALRQADAIANMRPSKDISDFRFGQSTALWVLMITFGLVWWSVSKEMQRNPFMCIGAMFTNNLIPSYMAVNIHVRIQQRNHDSCYYYQADYYFWKLKRKKGWYWRPVEGDCPEKNIFWLKSHVSRRSLSLWHVVCVCCFKMREGKRDQTWGKEFR